MGDGAIPASLFAFVASIPARCCKPQLRVRPGRAPGSAVLSVSPFPLLLLGTTAFLRCFLCTGDLHSLVREMLVPGRKLGMPGTCQIPHALGRGPRRVFSSTFRPRSSCPGHRAALTQPSGAPASCRGAQGWCSRAGRLCLAPACGSAKALAIL